MKALAPFAAGGPLPRAADALWRRALPAGPAGRAAVLGAGLLVPALLLAGIWAPGWRSEASELRQRLAAQHAEQHQRAARAPDAPVPAVQWPAAAEDAERLRGLLGLAQRHGVVVRALRQERGGPAAGAARWLRVVMTAEAGYLPLRRFVEAALAADAALALDSLVLQRADTGSTTGSTSLRAEFAWALGSAAR